MSRMKTITKLIFAVVSTMFLTVGAMQAAERLDSIAAGRVSTYSGNLMDPPTTPCQLPD